MLYKYFSKERLDVVERRLIRFSPLRSLNDPFESLPLLGIKSEINKLLVEANIELDSYWANLEEKTDEAESELLDARRTIEDHGNKVSKPDLVGAEFMGNLGDDFGVLCLSRTNRSLLMWSHYTDNGKGYVLAFDEKHEFFNQKSLSGEATNPIPVVYSTDRQIVDVRDEQYYEKLLCRKSLDWSYEEEERIFTSFASSCEIVGTDDYNQKIILSDIPSDAVKAVYIGYNASKSTELALISSASRNFNECPVYKARICPDEYRVVFDQIESG